MRGASPCTQLNPVSRLDRVPPIDDQAEGLLSALNVNLMVGPGRLDEPYDCSRSIARNQINVFGANAVYHALIGMRTAEVVRR